MLLHLNGDLPSRFPGHERRLYLFSCRRKPCRRKDGSVRGFRGVRISKSAATTTASQQPAPVDSPKEQKLDLGSAIFGGPPSSIFQPSNPFSLSSSSGAPVNPFSSASTLAAEPAQKPASTNDTANGLAETFASKARLTSPPASEPKRPAEPWPAQSSFPRPYSQYHLDADYETLEADKKTVPAQAQVMDVDGGSSSASGGDGGKEDKELFESSMDKTFQRFADRLAHNPEQVLRYEYDGSPLLYSSTDTVGRRLDPHGHTQAAANVKITTVGGGSIPSCQNCGGKRTFELQLTPHAITMLEEDEPTSVALDGMDWGTIILGVCSNDCGVSGVAAGEVGYLEEWVGVQWEELAVSNTPKK